MTSLHANDDGAGALAEHCASMLARSRAISALERSACALQDASACEAGGARSALLQQALLDVEQVSAALAAIDGAALLTQTITLALQRLGAGGADASGALAADAGPVSEVQTAQTVLDLMLALSDYLAQLSAGAPPQLLRLTPYYRPLQQMLGAVRMHPADLFFPDLTLAVVIPAALSSASPDALADAPLVNAPLVNAPLVNAPLVNAPLANYFAWRQRFEKALLPFLKDSAGPHAGALRDVIAEVAQVQPDASAHTFWCALAGFAELVASGQLASGQHVKQLFGLINLQLRQLNQPSKGDGAPHLGMLRDALFFIAASEHSSEQSGRQVAALRHGYRLAGMVPVNLEQRDFNPRKARRDASLHVDVPLQMSLETPPETPLSGARVALRRVRVDLLERVATQAAAAAAAHQKLEGDVSALHAGMQDFSSTLSLLRLQLREVEAQAVAQMASQMTVSSSLNFDPLEFDRCTRLQQLVRVMTDSVNQVTVDHQDLIDGAERVASDLQHQLELMSSWQRDMQGNVQNDLLRLRFGTGARALEARAVQKTKGATGLVGAPSVRRVRHRP